MRFKSTLLGAAMIAAMTFGGCSDSPTGLPGSEVLVGDTIPLGQGMVRVWEQTDDNGNLAAVGLTFTEATLQGLPHETQQFSMMLPQKAAHSPFVHVLFDWNPHGHEPPGTYDTPHFDFHFYLTSPEERMATIPGPDTIAVNPDYIPRDYFSTGASVPNMGTHWLDAHTPELNGQPFDKTFIYGFYRGHMTFLEPMITKAFFESNPDVTVPIKQPAKFEKTGMYYPADYRITYDAQNKEYSVILDAMAMK